MGMGWMKMSASWTSNQVDGVLGMDRVKESHPLDFAIFVGFFAQSPLTPALLFDKFDVSRRR
jgi:hypothetical protein